MRLLTILLLLHAEMAVVAQEWQWSVPVQGEKGPVRAFLWIPEDCRHVRGVVLAPAKFLMLSWIDWVAGPFKKIDDTTFALQLRPGLEANLKTFVCTFIASHPGNAQYKPVVQQAQMRQYRLGIMYWKALQLSMAICYCSPKFHPRQNSP